MYTNITNGKTIIYCTSPCVIFLTTDYLTFNPLRFHKHSPELGQIDKLKYYNMTQDFNTDNIVII